MLSCLDVERQLTGRDPVNQSLYIWAKTMLPNYILSNLGDRMEMAHSVEGRLPFLDHHVVEAAARMPVAHEDQRHDGEVRAARGGAARADGGRSTRGRSTRSCRRPATMQQDGKLYTLLQDTLRSAALDGPGIYDRAQGDAAARRDADDGRPGRARADALLMWMTSLCLLHQRLVAEPRATLVG